MRAVSTVLDAALCLLLVSVSALTLAATPTGSPAASDADTADEAAELVATSTAQVTYEVGGTGPGGETASTRTVHDTLAGLLARAATANGTTARSSPDAQSTVNATGFVRAVTTRVERALQHLDHDLQVIARGDGSNANSTTGGRVVAGDAPPRDSDVHAAVLVVRDVRLTVRTWSA